MSKYYAGDVGTEIEVEVGSDISTATETTLYVKKPSGKEVVWTATKGAAGVSGITTVHYVVQTDDWNEAGWYTLQVYINMPSWRGKGDTVKFRIFSDYQ
jgi:hypothetical protein